MSNPRDSPFCQSKKPTKRSESDPIEALDVSGLTSRPARMGLNFAAYG